jgi:hypothetical protein
MGLWLGKVSEAGILLVDDAKQLLKFFQPLDGLLLFKYDLVFLILPFIAEGGEGVEGVFKRG